MVRTIITPTNNEIYIKIPNEYIGKTIEVSYLSIDEVHKEEETKNSNTSKFRGALKLSAEQKTSLEKHLTSSKNEWERDF